MKLKLTYIIILLANSLLLLGQRLSPQLKMETRMNLGEKHYLIQNKIKQWGLFTKGHKVVIAASYDTIFPLNRTKFDAETYAVEYTPTSYVIGEKGERQTLLDLKGNVCLKANNIMPRLMGEVVLIQNDKKWGLAQTSGKILVPATCARIEWYEDILALNNDKGWLLFDPIAGELITDTGYDTLIEVTNERYPSANNYYLLTQKDGLWGVLNVKGKAVVPAKYQTIKPLYAIRRHSPNRLCFLVKKENKWGIITTKNRSLVSIQYDTLKVNHADQACIVFLKGDKWGIIDAQGNEKISNCTAIKALGRFVNTYKIYKENKVGLWSGDKGIQLPSEYDRIVVGKLFFTCEKEGETFYVNKQNNQAVNLPIHEDIDYFSYQFYKIKQNKLWGLIDLNGKEILAPKYDYINSGTYSSNRIVVVKGARSGLIDSMGRELIEPTYDEISPIYLNRSKLYSQRQFFVVARGLKKGVLNYNGKELLAVDYDEILYDRKRFDGYFEVVKKEKKGLLKWDGTVLIAPHYETISALTLEDRQQSKDGIWKVKQNEKYGLLQIQQDVSNPILPLAYETIERIYSATRSLKSYFIVGNKGKYGIYNTDKQVWILPIVYTAIQTHTTDGKELRGNDSSFFQVEQGKQQLLFDLEGNLFE
ncbi:WG repeat-containing protein [Aureispira anguillae]|uniref:WG repeat-containing protein n=1 Tax=Aureispira anguillae TaxID=2864201 RepID=A0A915YKF0_9BACT|nr:WG repeat-containing protein [Aureispira anguillae]BDS14587.1 WG repeat-containing protein [Aureispira anguillae]